MFADRTRWNLEPNRFSLALEKLRASGAKLLDLTASNPTRIGLSYAGPELLVSLAHPESLVYEPEPRGLLLAREAVGDYYTHQSCRVPPERLILTTSTSEAYSFAFRLLCNAGDQVLIPTPSYPLFEFLAQLQDAQLVPYDLVYDHGWQIDFHSLHKAFHDRTRAIILVNPNNPTGSFVKEHERKQLNELCRRRELALIVDEVFLDFSLGDQVLSFARNEEALTFTLSGLSKISGLPQMKLAWMAVSGPGEQRDEALARLEVIADTYLSLNAPIQHAAREMLELRRSFQPALMERIRTNLYALDQQLAKQKLCSRLQVEGGWYATLRVPVTRSDEQLAIELLERESVIVHPGHFFDFHSDGYLILSLIAPEQEFAEGVRRVVNLIGQT